MFFFSAKHEICYSIDGNSLYSCSMNLDNIFTNLIQNTLQIGDITTKSVSSVTLIGITIDSKLIPNTSIIQKKHIINYMTSEDYKISDKRKSQNLSLFSDRKSISLMSINLDVLLKNRYMQRLEKM